MIEGKSSNSNQLQKIPAHIAIIMDGNGRWAKRRGAKRTVGHENGILAVRSVIEGAAELGVKFLTLYTFSIENWNRPEEEVNLLMSLFVRAIHEEVPKLMKNNIRLQAIGDFSLLPAHCQQELYGAVERTAGNSGLTVVLALSYSARWEITEMTRKVARDVQNKKLKIDEISQPLISNYLATAEIPDPEILIRTGGEYRISNFLLWQIAYTELFFSKKMWPDFRKKDLKTIIEKYQLRESRFGKTSEQLSQS